MTPMLATLVDEPFDNPAWLFEVKWDGYRAIAAVEADGKLTLKSRNGLDLLKRFKGIGPIGGAFRSLPVVVDGEICAIDDRGRSSFQALQQADAMTNGKPRTALTFVAFDLLYADGRDLRNLPLEERKAKLEALIVPDRGVIFSQHIVGRGKEFFALAQRESLEGIIAKRRDSPYRMTRSRDWLKIKAKHEEEFVIGGWTEPKGSRSDFGALLLGYYDGDKLVFSGQVGTGFNQKLLRSIGAELRKRERKTSPFAELPRMNPPAHFVTPELVAQIAFAEWTDEGLLRQPVFLGLRAGQTGPRSHARTRAAKSASGMTAARSAKTQLTVGKRSLQVTNLDKVLWPHDGYTKGDLIAYYRAVSRWLLPHVQGRPLTMERYPNGIDEPGFWEKHIPRGLPEWIPTVKTAPSERHDLVEFIICDDEATLAYVANLASVVLHVWYSREPTLDVPDFILIDLDPVGRLHARDAGPRRVGGANGVGDRRRHTAGEDDRRLGIARRHSARAALRLGSGQRLRRTDRAPDPRRRAGVHHPRPDDRPAATGVRSTSITCRSARAKRTWRRSACVPATGHRSRCRSLDRGRGDAPQASQGDLARNDALEHRQRARAPRQSGRRVDRGLDAPSPRIGDIRRSLALELERGASGGTERHGTRDLVGGNQFRTGDDFGQAVHGRPRQRSALQLSAQKPTTAGSSTSATARSAARRSSTPTSCAATSTRRATTSR